MTFNLPAPILASLLREWLSWKDLSALDVACLHKESREVLLGLFAHPDGIQPPPCGLGEDSNRSAKTRLDPILEQINDNDSSEAWVGFLRWMVSREMHLLALNIKLRHLPRLVEVFAGNQLFPFIHRLSLCDNAEDGSVNGEEQEEAEMDSEGDGIEGLEEEEGGDFIDDLALNKMTENIVVSEDPKTGVALGGDSGERILGSALVSSNTSMDEEDQVVVVQQPPTEIARQLKGAIREGGGGGEDDDNSRDFVLTPSHVQAFLALFPLLQSLACENWHDITDRHLQAIAEMQLSLQELSFIEHDWLDCRLIGQIACQSASTLQYLRCGYLDVPTLDLISMRCAALHTLLLIGNKLSVEKILRFCDRHPDIHSLGLAVNPELPANSLMITDETFHEIILKCPHLHRIDVAFHADVSLQSILEAVKHCPFLQYVSVPGAVCCVTTSTQPDNNNNNNNSSRCIHLTLDNIVVPFVQERDRERERERVADILHFLSHVSLPIHRLRMVEGIGPTLDDLSLQILADRFGPSLTHLQLALHPNMNRGEVVQRLLAKCPNLHNLCLHSLNMHSKTWKMIPVWCPRLRVLEVKGSHLETKTLLALLEGLSCSSHNISSFGIGPHKGIATVVLEKIPETFPKLRRLSLDGVKAKDVVALVLRGGLTRGCQLVLREDIMDKVLLQLEKLHCELSIVFETDKGVGVGDDVF